jgi:chitinase
MYVSLAIASFCLSANEDLNLKCGTTSEFCEGVCCPMPASLTRHHFHKTSLLTTFWTGDCQSNCVLHPKPPRGGSALGILDNRVIGYYEAWSARKECHKIGPTDIALDALTQYVASPLLKKIYYHSHAHIFPSINFAFASIEPGSYKVIPMDSQTPESLFREVPNLKSIKHSLKVFISIGGW